MSEKHGMLVTEKEKKLIEKLRTIKFAKEITVTVVEGEPTKTGVYKEEENL
jgi:predicted transcriptional regulator